MLKKREQPDYGDFCDCWQETTSFRVEHKSHGDKIYFWWRLEYAAIQLVFDLAKRKVYTSCGLGRDGKYYTYTLLEGALKSHIRKACLQRWASLLQSKVNTESEFENGESANEVEVTN